MKKKPLRTYLGNFLILFGFLILFYIYYPLINLYLNPPKVEANLPKVGYFLTIPKISAQAPIVENVNPFLASEYRPALEKGVAKAKLETEESTNSGIFLFAHSSDNPLRITRYNTIFLKLNELTFGDEIVLTKDGKDIKYRVFDKKEVWPTEIKYLKNIQDNELILQTCTPIGTAFKRLLIFAKKEPA